jgi:hypothetical protein
MGLSKRNADKAIEGLGMIFPEGAIKTIDPKGDGGFEEVTCLVERIPSAQFGDLKDLTDQIPNSFGIKPQDGMLLLYFF